MWHSNVLDPFCESRFPRSLKGPIGPHRPLSRIGPLRLCLGQKNSFFSNFILLETCIQSSWNPQHVLVHFRPCFTEIKWLKINVVSLQSPFHFHLAKTTWTILLELHIREGKLCTCTWDLQYSTEDSNTILLSETCIKKVDWVLLARFLWQARNLIHNTHACNGALIKTSCPGSYLTKSLPHNTFTCILTRS